MLNPPSTAPPAADRDPPNEVLGGRYELLETIGEGGMSTVHRALDRTLGRHVAVKVIRHDPAADPEHLRARFRREAANAARIPPHPNLVQIYDYGTDAVGDRDFIVMELLRGRDLKAVLRERRPGTNEGVGILLQAARGVAAGHRAGIVHRDVKPGNILLAGDGPHAEVRVLDFGIAKLLEGDPDDDLTRLGHAPHTPAYASPEQWAGRAPGPASDVYQLGLVAYELLAGERAFDAGDRERMAMGESVPLPARGGWQRVPAPLRAVVERALRPEPAERYPDAAAFAEALAVARDDDHTVAAPHAPDDATMTVAAAPPARAPVLGPRGRAMVADRWRALPRVARAALVALGVMLLLLAVLRGGGGDAAEVAAVPEAPSTSELEDEFAPLYRDAAERLAEESEAEDP